MGGWGNNLQVGVDFNTKDLKDGTLFNLTILEIVEGVVVTTVEKFLNVSVDPEQSPLCSARAGARVAPGQRARR